MTLEDIVAQHEIGRAISEFARGMDERDWPALEAILTEDSTADFGNGALSGSKAIVALIGSYLDACGPTQHLLGNLLVEVSGDTAQSRCYVNDIHLGQGDRSHLTYRTLGDYHDSWRRIDGRWRLIHRQKYNRAHVGTMDVFG